ncbi:hypothetical protein [Mycolicibacterium neworleansense]|uniref:Uncharacterized protein n=1 Tax=Mycolicibacterium neworleansense TaxID=146018 RepID=A0A0H5RM35_9MYCO|nr:hypothetical protein [Mycolicibacterium neworleansense]CRZ14816.1 hypothetical protein BN2156_01672 [Mycolicibacterium neworleansense]
MADPIVALDLATRRAWVAGVAVAVQPRPGGGLAVGDRVIRPLRFGERWRVVDDAVNGGNRIGATVLAWATESPAAPATLTAAGWDSRAVFDTDADLIDLLTTEASDGGAVDGWTSIVLTTGPEPVSPAEALRILEGDLLGRLAAAEADEPSNPDVPSACPSGADAGTQSVPPLGSRRAAADGAATGTAAPIPGRHADAEPPGTAVPNLGPAPKIRDDNHSGTTEPGERPASHPATEPAFPVPIRATGSTGWPAAGPWLPPIAGPGVDNHAAQCPVPPTGHADQRSDERTEPPAHRVSAAAVTEAPNVVRDDPTAPRAERLAAPAATGADPFDTANLVAALLDEESDLRGLLP